MLNLARQVRNIESDCRAIECAQDLDDLSKITMIEKWSSRGTYEGPHMESPHMHAFIEKSGKLFVGPPDISYCQGTEIDE